MTIQNVDHKGLVKLEELLGVDLETFLYSLAIDDLLNIASDMGLVYSDQYIEEMKKSNIKYSLVNTIDAESSTDYSNLHKLLEKYK